MITWFMQTVLHLRKDRRGVTIIEYALLAALIGVALVAALTSLNGKISNSLVTIGNSL